MVGIQWGGVVDGGHGDACLDGTPSGVRSAIAQSPQDDFLLVEVSLPSLKTLNASVSDELNESNVAVSNEAPVIGTNYGPVGVSDNVHVVAEYNDDNYVIVETSNDGAVNTSNDYALDANNNCAMDSSKDGVVDNSNNIDNRALEYDKHGTVRSYDNGALELPEDCANFGVYAMIDVAVDASDVNTSNDGVVDAYKNYETSYDGTVDGTIASSEDGAINALDCCSVEAINGGVVDAPNNGSADANFNGGLDTRIYIPVDSFAIDVSNYCPIQPCRLRYAQRRRCRFLYRCQQRCNGNLSRR